LRRAIRFPFAQSDADHFTEGYRASTGMARARPRRQLSVERHDGGVVLKKKPE
jgi:hypothetical protein